jgi:hypothetical protein
MVGLVGTSDEADVPGVSGENTGDGEGIRGTSRSARGGVVGVNNNPADDAGQAVDGESCGVYGRSNKGEGVRGVSHGSFGGLVGVNDGAGPGVRAVSKDGAGLAALSTGNEAIHAETHSPGTAAIAAFNLNPEGTGASIFALKEGTKGHAGFFVGDVFITGGLGVGKDITLANADCAEDFDVEEADFIEPGTVMLVGEEGVLRQSYRAYDKRVAGVISGAGGYKPGIVLGKQQPQSNRKPIALLGKVFCKVDAQFGAIEVGDLLTTSPTLGHAMKVSDPLKAFGAVIGKALRPLQKGKGLIPILIAMQ